MGAISELLGSVTQRPKILAGPFRASITDHFPKRGASVVVGPDFFPFKAWVPAEVTYHDDAENIRLETGKVFPAYDVEWLLRGHMVFEWKDNSGGSTWEVSGPRTFTWSKGAAFPERDGVKAIYLKPAGSIEQKKPRSPLAWGGR